MDYKISAIIPVYNKVKYIERAVESVLKQKDSELIQIILVDDGSSDGSELVCDRLEEKYPNVFTYHQLNSGVSSARNLGIEKSTGEWLSFIDCDDYLLDGFYEKLLSGETADLLCCDLCFEESGFPLVGERIKEGIYKKNDFNEILYPIMADTTVFYSACNKVFRADLIKKNVVRFPVGMRLAEDMIFVFEYVKHIESFKFVNERLYYYYVNETSVTRIVDKSFEIHKTAFIYKTELFKALNAKNEIINTVQLNFLMDAVSSIFVAVQNLSFLSSRDYIKSIINDEVFAENYNQRPICACAKGIMRMINEFILWKKPLIILLLIRLNDIRIELFSKISG